MEKLGIIGGLGPAATARLFERIVEYTQVDRDQDHIDITILNRPQIPDRTAYLLGEPGARPFAPAMSQAAHELEDAGCTVIATPCNTAHAAHDEIAAGLTRARFVNMLTETARFMARLGCARVGVLATDGTVQTRVYERTLAGEGIGIVLPDDASQRAVMSLIYDQVKAGTIPGPEQLEEQCARLVARGADGVILGCTELSVIPCARMIAQAPVVDALDILAWRCVVECGAPTFDMKTRYDELAQAAVAADGSKE